MLSPFQVIKTENKMGWIFFSTLTAILEVSMKSKKESRTTTLCVVWIQVEQVIGETNMAFVYEMGAWFDFPIWVGEILNVG